MNHILHKHFTAGVLALTVTASTLLSGCGSASSGANGTLNAAADVRTADAAGTSSKDGLQTLRVGVCSGDQNQVLGIVDKHTGLFKNAGIDFQTTEFAAGINTIDAITTGSLDIGNFADYAGVNRIGNTLQSTELRAFTQSTINDKYALYVNPKKIKTADDLYHSVLISQAGVVFEYEYSKLFEKDGIDESKIKLTNVDGPQAALALAQKGTGDAYWANPNLQPKFESYGWKPFATLNDVDAPMYCFLVANQSFLKKNQKLVETYLKKSEEGFDYVDKHLDQVAKWVYEDTGLDEQLFKDGWKANDYTYQFNQDTYDDLKKVEKWCYKAGRFPTDYEVGDYINTDALKAVYPDRVSWKEQ